MALWYVHDGQTFSSVTWSDGIRGDVYVYCMNTGLFHPDQNITYSYYTNRGPYHFNAISPGIAGMMIQEGCGFIDPGRGLLHSYQTNPEHLTVQQVMLTVTDGV